MSPIKAYYDQLHHANERHIVFSIGYTKWLELWLISGRWEQRGKKKEQYQMCRYYDEGPYSSTNCYIGTVEQNQKDRHKIPSGETGDIITTWLQGKYTQKEIGDIFDLSQSAISKIINRKRRSNEIYT